MTASTPCAPATTPAPDTGWRAFWPAPVAVDLRERVRVILGAALGIGVTGLVSHAASAALGPSWLWLVASMGASAVLVFGVSSSPMAQPWAVVVGHTVAALIGVACASAQPLAPAAVVGAVAVGASIAAMFALRCVHPPAGGTALMMTLGSLSDVRLALFPVATNAVLLVLVGMAFHRATRRRYPHSQWPTAAPATTQADSSLDAELDAVLKRYNQVLDISREDLQALLHQTQLQAYQHKLERLTCADIMVRELVTVHTTTTLAQAWSLLRERHIKALPVVDANQRLVGLVTLADFLRGAGWQDALKSQGPPGHAQSTVGDIMTRQVRVASGQRHLAELVPLFASTGHHHIPVIEGDAVLVGMLTQTDVVAALCAVDARAASAPVSADR